MKQSKLTRETAYPAAPQISDGFVPPVDFDFKISVDLRDHNIRVYGFDGSQWNMIHDTDGTISDFVADVVYQKYYLESKTGSNQEVRVSFLSSLAEPNLHSFEFGSTDSSRKLHHFGDVPVYRAGEAGKFLTIRTDGSLAWLGINESFTVESESGEEGAEVGLEEDASLALYGNAQLTDGVLILDGTNNTYASLPHSTEYDREAGDLTVHFWFNADSLPAADNNYALMSRSTGPHNWNGWVITYSTQEQDQGNSGPLMVNGGIGVYASNQGTGGASAQANNFRATVAGGVAANTWNHVAVTMPATGNYTIYLNGQNIGSWLPPYKNDSANTELIFGATKGLPVGSLVKFFPGELDQVFISKSILTASEIHDLHAAGRDVEDIPGIFIEELPAAANNIFRPVYNSITNGIFTQTSPSPGHKGGTKVDLDVEGILDYSGNSLDPKEWTLSFWVAAESVISAGHNYCGGRFEANKELRLAMGKTGDGFMQFKPIIGNLWTGTPKAKSTIPFAVGQFQHCAITYGLSPGHTNKYDLKIFIDGVKGGEALQKSFHVLDKNADGALFGIGKATSGATFIGNGGAFSLDSVQIAQGALTEPQVAAIAAQTDRQMGIEAASLL